MFGFFKKKEKRKLYSKLDRRFVAKSTQNHPASTNQGTDSIENHHDLIWIDNYIKVEDNFPRVDWQGLADAFEQGVIKESDIRSQSEFWRLIIKTWLIQLSDQMADDHELYESEHFYILSAASDGYLRTFIQYLESIQHRISRSLKNIAQHNERGKFVVLVFENIDLYYSYISHYYPEDGEFAMSGGIFLGSGYGHFVVPHSELNHIESVAAHELTHAMLAHVPIPLWLNEGLAVNMEAAITGYSSYQLNKQKQTKHLNYWDEKSIQDFWSGESFGHVGEAGELSYHLAQLIVRSLSEDYQSFTEFVNQASYEDGGEAEAIEVFGGSLGAIIEQIYGEGDWSPKPELWQGAGK